MKERTAPCIFYTNCGSECQKGVKNVTHTKTCQHCSKYRPRKTGNVKRENKEGKLRKIRNKEYKRERKEW